MKNTESKKIEHKGTRILLRNPDGSEIEIGLAEIRNTKERVNRNFAMLWSDSYKSTGIIALDLWMYLIKKSHYNWVYNITDEDLAEAIGTTRRTIIETKKKLRKAELIKYEPKAILLNPWIVFKGSANKRAECKIEWQLYEERRSTKRGASTLGAAPSAKIIPEEVHT